MMRKWACGMVGIFVVAPLLGLAVCGLIAIWPDRHPMGGLKW